MNSIRTVDWTLSIENAIGMVHFALGPAARWKDVMHAVAPMLPYALHAMGEMPEHLIWVNRAYKPLGVRSGRWVKYEDFTHLHVRRGDERIARLLPVCDEVDTRYGGDGGDSFFLFSDDSDPRYDKRDARRYSERLALIDLGESAA